MYKYQFTIVFLLTLISLIMVLDAFSLLNVSTSDIAAYSFIFLGLRFAYTSFGSDKSSILFLSTISFFLGLLLFIISHFTFLAAGSVLLPALLFIISSGFFILFLNKPQNRLFLIGFVFFLMIASVFVITFGRLSFGSFIFTFPEILSKYWLIFIICVIIILTFKREEE